MLEKISPNKKTVLFLSLILVIVLILGACTPKPRPSIVLEQDAVIDAPAYTPPGPLKLRSISWQIVKEENGRPLYCLSGEGYGNLSKNTEDVQNRLHNYMITLQNFSEFQAK